MPTIVKSFAGDKLLHSNSYVAADFNTSEFIEQTKLVTTPAMSGQMSQWIFDGIRISYSDILYTLPNDVEWNGNLDVVTLGFNLKGDVTISPSDAGKALSFTSRQHNAIYTANAVNTMRNKSLASEMFMVQFNKDAFLRLTENTTDNLMRFRDSILSCQPIKISEQNAPVDSLMQGIISSLLNCGYTGRIKQLFFLSKSIELLVLQSQAFAGGHLQKQAVCQTEADKERIYHAAEYLVQHYDRPPTLTALAQIVGINEFKLKKGFKEIFGTTAFGYLTNYKMEVAKQQLSQKQATVSEVAYQLGYSSPQHFSTAFKGKFGFSPKELK